MKVADVSPAFEVLYASATDSFRTVQCYPPVHGEHYKVLDAHPVMLRGSAGWYIDDSDPHTPRAVRLGKAVPLNQAIREGKVIVVGAPEKAATETRAA